MSEFDTKKITDRAGTGAPNFTYGVNIGGSDSGLIGKAYTASGTEPSSPANGDTWYDTANDKYYIYADGAFKQITHSNAATLVDGGDRGLYMGGYGRTTGAVMNVIQYWSMASTGNATDFGDLTIANRHHSATSDGTRAFTMGGVPHSYKHIDAIVVATTGNATDHGDLIENSAYGAGNCDGTIALAAASDRQASRSNSIDRFTTSSASNATDHGDLTVARNYIGGNISNGTNGIFFGGMGSGSPQTTNVIDQVGIATAANATDFGDLNTTAYYGSGTSENVRGLIHKGTNVYASVNELSYITIGTAGNATDFGDLSVVKYDTSMCANIAGRACISGGQLTGAPHSAEEIEYVDINTLGNAADFGNLLDQTQSGDSASGT